ncbi:hypothetical protein, partial [Burkholderia multivorans]|uniref:hypothetical protein n=1 Tax=Burkholderia multivorans TaxID=87883 RepID=UPI001C614209
HCFTRNDSTLESESQPASHTKFRIPPFRPGKSAIAKGGGWIPSASVTPVLELLSKVGVEQALT